MARILGIDLGTTNSCVAVLDESGAPRVLSAADGLRITPSVVSYSSDGVVVGVPARRQMVTRPASTISGIKRLIGRKVNAADVAWFARSAPFEIVAAPNGDAWIRIDGRPCSPQEVASHVLRRMRAIAEESCGEAVTRAVVTVPAYFDDAQRQATRDAGTIAGLDVVRLLNEPTAAALAYGAHRVRSGRRVIAVFDLGGGTFDISIMAVDDGVFEVLATGGESALGGDDWDRSLVEQLVDELEKVHGIDPTTDPVAMSRLVEAAEASKRALSSEQSTTIGLPFLGARGAEPFHYSRALARDELDRSSTALRERLRQPCQRALDDAGLRPGDIEEVLLVGGMSRNLAVQEIVTEIFGRVPSKSVNPDEVVALGAAAYAGILAGQLDDAALLDVTPHTIGIKIGDGFTPVIPRNSMLPVRESKMFATSHDDQRYVAVEIYQGEHDDVRRNRKLGNVRLENLPPGKAGSVRVELVMTVDVESILHVTARELSTGRSTEVRIEPTGGLSARDLAGIVERRRSEERDE